MKVKKTIKNIKKLNLSNLNIKGVLDMDQMYNVEELDCSNNEIISIINLPYSLKYLNCSNNKITSLVNLLNSLIGMNCKNNPLEILHYPLNIKPLKYPDGLKKIIFGKKFNQIVDNLPNSLTEIEFVSNSDFDQLVDNLPSSIQNLTVGYYFSQPLDNLPNSLKIITLTGPYIFSLDNLPNSIETIIFYSLKNKINKLPISLKHLYVMRKYKEELNFDNLKLLNKQIK